MRTSSKGGIKANKNIKVQKRTIIKGKKENEEGKEKSIEKKEKTDTRKRSFRHFLYRQGQFSSDSTTVSINRKHKRRKKEEGAEEEFILLYLV